MVFIALLVGALVSAQILSGAALERIPVRRTFFYYEQNVGQADPAVRFLVRGVPTPIYLTADSIWLNSGYANSVATVRFASSAAVPDIRSLEAWPGILNRFEGDARGWLRAIPAHRRLLYSGIHPGIDLIVREAGGQPAFTFVVRPGGDLGALFLEASSPNSVTTSTSVDPQRGDWFVSAALGRWTLGKPSAWQESGGDRTPIQARFVASSEVQVRFEVADFDRTRPLYIDVGLNISPWSPFVSSDPHGNLAVDASNNVYLSGAVRSTAACGSTGGGGFIYCPDAFVAALRPNGEPIFLTVLAGRFEDSAAQLVLDSSSNIIITGNTASDDFPVTRDAFQPANAGPPGPVSRYTSLPYGDLFVARLDPRTGDLLFSSFFGGPEGEAPQSLAIARDGSVTVLASVGKSFPTTPGAWIRSSECGSESCNAVVRFDGALARPLFSTFVPGSALKMAVDSDSSIYLAGAAREGAPTTEGAFQPNNGGDSDAYIVRLAPDGSRPMFASFFGGAAADSVLSLAIDARGDAWLHGETWEMNAQPFSQTSWLVRVRGDGSQLVSSQFFPGRRFHSNRLLIDSAGRLLLSGFSISPVLETTADAVLRAGCGNHYFEQRDTNGSLRFASYLPGNPTDVALAPSGDIYRVSGDGIERVDLRAPATFSLACVTSAASRQNRLASTSELMGRIAPGEIITLIGSRLGPETGVSADPGETGRYPTSLAGVRVLIGNTPAPLLYVQASQINAVVPYSIPPGQEVEVAVESDGRAVSLRVETVAAEFSLFTADGSGFGQAAALNEDGTLNSRLNPARRGSIVALFGTGAGITIPASIDGALAPVTPPDALPKPAGRILLNGPGAEVVYAGAAPGLVNGLTQINVRISEAMPENVDRLDIGVYAGYASPGNYATVAVR